MFDGPCLVSSSKKRTLAKVVEHNKFAMLRNLSLSELNEFHLHQCRNKKLYRKLAPMAFSTKRKVKKTFDLYLHCSGESISSVT